MGNESYARVSNTNIKNIGDRIVKKEPFGELSKQHLVQSSKSHSPKTTNNKLKI